MNHPCERYAGKFYKRDHKQMAVQEFSPSGPSFLLRGHCLFAGSFKSLSCFSIRENSWLRHGFKRFKVVYSFQYCRLPILFKFHLDLGANNYPVRDRFYMLQQRNSCFGSGSIKIEPDVRVNEDEACRL